MDFPRTCTTQDERVIFCYRVIEKLKEWHNLESSKIGTALTLEAFKEWQRKEFRPRLKEVHAYINDTGVKCDTLAPQILRKESFEVSLWDGGINLEAIKKRGAIGPLVDPLENLLTYTEVDPDSAGAVAADRITMNNIPDISRFQCYFNKGTNYFAGNFNHYLLSRVTGFTAISAQYLSVWSLSDAPLSLLSPPSAAALALMKADPSPWPFSLVEYTPTKYSDVSLGTTYGLFYYHHVHRDMSVGTHGTLYCDIYTDAARTVLFDTLSLAMQVAHNHSHINTILLVGSSPFGTTAGCIVGDYDLFSQRPSAGCINGGGIAVGPNQLSLGVNRQ